MAGGLRLSAMLERWGEADGSLDARLRLVSIVTGQSDLTMKNKAYRPSARVRRVTMGVNLVCGPNRHGLPA